jgi:adenine specific DNA methylase Mod
MLQNKPYHIECCNNIVFLEKISNESIDLIYIDPPFNTGRDFKEFNDSWYEPNPTDILIVKNHTLLHKYLFTLSELGNKKSKVNYLYHIGARVLNLHRILKNTGSIYVHIDPKTSHYIKLMMDIVFGENNFRSNITWERSNDTGTGKSLAKFYPNNTDFIFHYTKTNIYSWNPQMEEGSKEKVLSKFKLDDGDGKGLYYWENLRNYSDERLNNLKSNNELMVRKSGKYSYKRYLSSVNNNGVVVSNLWNDINRITRPDYPTQKPEALLERIIRASSNEGDVVLDCYLGSGTTAKVARNLNRKFIGCDNNPKSIETTLNRLENE